MCYFKLKILSAEWVLVSPKMHVNLAQLYKIREESSGRGRSFPWQPIASVSAGSWSVAQGTAQQLLVRAGTGTCFPAKIPTVGMSVRGR